LSDAFLERVRRGGSAWAAANGVTADRRRCAQPNNWHKENSRDFREHLDKVELDGQTFTALNGGPVFQFNEAVSFQVNCDTQEEMDYLLKRLSEGGDERRATFAESSCLP